MLELLTKWLGGDASGDLIPSHFGFNVALSTGMVVLLLAGAGVTVVGLYWFRLARLATGPRTALVFLRTIAIVLVLFLALDPMLIAQRVRPGEQFVLLLFDDSQSMRIASAEGQTRGERLVERYRDAASEFEVILKRKHQVARYRVGVTATPLRELGDLRFDQYESNLAGGVAAALRDFEGATVSAVVLFSDGVQQVSEGAGLADLALGVPVYTVGVDDASHWSDIEVRDLSVKRADFDQSPVMLTATLHSTGLSGREAVIELMDGERVVQARTIAIEDVEQEHEVRFEYVPTRVGWVPYTVRVRLAELDADRPNRGDALRDRIAQNDAKVFVVDNRETIYKVLYVSSRPSWQNKFVRRALDEDEHLRMTSLLTISDAEPKFVFRGKRSSLSNPLFEGFNEGQDRPRYDESVTLRIGPDAKALTAYPSDAETLFDFNLVIFADIQRSFHTAAQLDLTRSFVEKRGGTLLLLGGPDSFTEGGYADTVIAGMLPVAMYGSGEAPETRRAEKYFEVRPTMEGTLTGSWSFASEHEENVSLWAQMPPLFGLNRFLFARPGASVMAVAGGELENAPVFVVQRYGEGKCAVLATGDTWQWQLGLDEKDNRHEQLWRQIVRNLVSDSPEPVMLRNVQDAYVKGRPVDLEFIVRDSVFDRREGLQCTVTLAMPDGDERVLSVEESIQEFGLYTSSFMPEETGLYSVALTALDHHGEVVGRVEEAFMVEGDRREYRHAQYDPGFLRKMAEATGAEMYSLDGLGELARAIPVPLRTDADEVRLHLWRFPPFYLLLIFLLIPEWYLRRRKGQA